MSATAAGTAVDRLSPVWPRYTELEIERAEGARLYTYDGDSYLDFTAGIAVTSTGHCHPRVVDAIHRQAEALLHGQLTIVRSRPVVELTEELAAVLPEQLGYFFFANSGSEAVESALKLVRHASGRPNVIVFQGGYHGRTLGALSLTTAKAVYRSGYQPLVAGVCVAPFPYPDQHEGEASEDSVSHCLAELELILTTYSTPEETAAVFIEPVLGEGGYVPAPTSFMQGLRELCNRHDLLLVADEAQSGFGRTGLMFACEHSRIWPDVMVLAKGIASGMPLSCIAASHDLMAKWAQGSHGGTYGGNPVCAAAAVATLRILREEQLVENARHRGAELLSRLTQLQAQSSLLGDVRGLGLMLACEFSLEDGQADPRSTRAVREGCLADGLVLTTCGRHDHVLRFVPPLTVSAAEIDEAVGIFEAALRRVDDERIKL